jgi:transposase InsO family protein
VYAAQGPSPPTGPPAKRGPKTRWTDAELVAGICTILGASPFHGEGYRKIRARLAHRGLAVSGKRVLRLMHQYGLLAPRRLGPPNGDPAHAGTIITDRPDVMWGTDATRFYTEREGWCWFFSAIDHGIDELLGWHVAKLGDRWAALEPIRQGVRHAFGAFRKDVARGLAIRCDWGPQYIADAWINEVKWLGITISPSYVGEPQCNGVIERFMRTLKEQCLYLHRFQTLEEARQVIAAFIHRYNHEWLIERLGYRTPAQARAEGWRAAA